MAEHSKTPIFCAGEGLDGAKLPLCPALPCSVTGAALLATGKECPNFPKGGYKQPLIIPLPAVARGNTWNWAFQRQKGPGAGLAQDLSLLASNASSGIAQSNSFAVPVWEMAEHRGSFSFPHLPPWLMWATGLWMQWFLVPLHIAMLLHVRD